MGASNSSASEEVTRKPFGFLKAHPGRDGRTKSGYQWTRVKAELDISDEKNRKYWRVHDDYYDLSEFKHPGGQDWLDFTRGNDVTELFESCHPNMDMVRPILKKYLVGPAKEPRNSGAFTFKSDGFYMTFRKRAWEILRAAGTGPTLQMLFIHDSMLSLFLLFTLATMNPYCSDIAWVAAAAAAGFMLQCVITSAHNFFHKRANWRMYSFDLCPYSSYEWRISHAYSHHTFPNTAYDLETTLFEPFILHYPRAKSALRKLFTPLIFFVITFIGMHLQFVQRLGRILLGYQRLRWEHFLPAALCITMAATRIVWMAFAEDRAVAEYLTKPVVVEALRVACFRINIMYFLAAHFFHCISLSVGHHSPNIWHEGDKIVDSLDWGIFQIVSSSRADFVDRSLLLTVTSFGNHVLHHLLPTVDHSKLPLVHDVYIKTCKEYGIDFKDEFFAERNITPLRGFVVMIQEIFRSKTSDSNFPFYLKRL